MLQSSQQKFWLCGIVHVVKDITRFNTVTQFLNPKILQVQSNR